MNGTQQDIETVRTTEAVRQTVAAWRRAGLSVALVPTMGSLHDGHLSLVRHALDQAQRVVVSLFVNPTQFGPTEDFSRYPRQEAADLLALTRVGCHAVFMPTVAEMYPEGFSTTINVGPLGQVLEGEFRPGHFQGVATVVTKLLLQVLPDLALFGEKDWQQLMVIRRTARDLNIPVEIKGLATVRSDDGLALSSRNAYLSAEERAVASVLHDTLQRVAAGLKQGQWVADLCAEAVVRLQNAGFRAVDYVAVCHPDTLIPADRWTGAPLRILAAAHLGTTRLIDNIAVAAD